MQKTPRRPALLAALGLALLLVAGAVPAFAASTAPDATTDGAGSTTAAPPPELRADVSPPPDGLDGLEELNPVDQSALEDLTLRYPPTAPIFRKYAYRPACLSTGCPGGIDHLAAGTGTRNTGYGTIRFRGALPGAIPVSAFLYWATIANGPFPVNQTVTFNGASVTGFAIGTGPNPCWGFGGGNLVAYRAAVLPNLLPGINGDYRVSGLPTNLTNGQDPWNPVSTTFPLSEGASLVVLYTHSSIPAGTWVQIHHPIGATTSTFGTLTYTHFLNLPIQTAAVKQTRIGADGQVLFGLTNGNPTTNERTSLAGPAGTGFVQIRGNGSYGSGNEDSDWNGTDGEPLNQLWDTHTMNIPGVIAPGPGVTSYQVRYVSLNDCIVPVVHVLTAR